MPSKSPPKAKPSKSPPKAKPSKSPPKARSLKLNLGMMMKIPGVGETIFNVLNQSNIKSGARLRKVNKYTRQFMPLVLNNKLDANKRKRIVTIILRDLANNFMYNYTYMWIIKRGLMYKLPGTEVQVKMAKKYKEEIEERLKGIIGKINELMEEHKDVIKKDDFYDYIDKETDFDTWEKKEMVEFFENHKEGFMNFPQRKEILKCMEHIRDVSTGGFRDYNMKGWKWTLKHNGMTEGIFYIYRDVIEPYNRGVGFLNKRNLFTNNSHSNSN